MKTLILFFGSIVLIIGLIVKEVGTDKNSLIFHRILIGNGGKGRIVSPHIDYGGHELNIQSQTEYPPIRRGWKGIAPIVTAGMDLPIPTSATITWTTENGESHLEVVPISSLIRDRKKFYGFNFVFVDSYVDIYLIERKNVGAKEEVPITEEIKMFSTKK